MFRKNLTDDISDLGYAGVQKVFERMGYKFFTGGVYDINIFGVRNDRRESNAFDDALCYAFLDDSNRPRLVACRGTTDPGLKTLKTPQNPSGAAILVPGQYRKTWEIGTHGAGRPIEHTALCQRLGKVKVYRDDNRDKMLDMDGSPVETGYFGINIHRASKYQDLLEVGAYSAGCQVFQSNNDFTDFMTVVKHSAKLWGNHFTYTLFTEKQFFRD